MKKHIYLLFAVCLIFSACKKTPETCFTYSNAEGSLLVSFTNCSIDATTYDWDFGDGTSSIAENPSHTFSTSGNHDVTLRATSKQGISTTLTQTISLTGPPNLIFTGEYLTNYVCDDSSQGSSSANIFPIPGTTDRVYLDSTYTYYAIVRSNLTITVPRQTAFFGPSFEGEGTYASGGNTATLTYRYYNTGSSTPFLTCNVAFTR